MYNSIQEFLSHGTGKIEKRIKNFIEEKKDLADLVIGLQEELYELGRNILLGLLQGEKAPDHNTIARFRSGRVNEAVEDLFHQFVEKLHQLGEIGFENLFVDGTKIEACVNKYSFVWKRATSKNEARLQIKLRKLLNSLGYPQDNENPISVEYMQEIHRELQEIKSKKGIVFVQGRGKHKTQLQRDIEALETCISLQQKYDNTMLCLIVETASQKRIPMQPLCT